MKRAVYAGSFDPPTNGHVWMIEQGKWIFDELVVAVGVNPDKKYMFTIEERITMLKDITKRYDNVVVKSFENQFLINYARYINADFILRGVRTTADFEYEKAMRYINADLDKRFLTVPLMPPRELVEISSSVVKGLIGPEGWEYIVKKYVPDIVYRKLREKFGNA